MHHDCSLDEENLLVDAYFERYDSMWLFSPILN
jgi:hypothetical protein